MATPSRAVHFDDPVLVMEAYQNQKVPAFGLFCSKQLITKYQGESMEEGEQALQFWVDSLMRDERAAIYTVALFEEVPKGGIKDNTPYDYSFNFRFFQTPNGYEQSTGKHYQARPMPGIAYRDNEVLAELRTLKDEVKRLQDKFDDLPEDGTVEKETIGDVIMRQIEPSIPMLVGKLIDFIPSPVKKADHLSGVNDVEQPSPQTDQQRIIAACQILNRSVTDLPDIMEKLARMSVKQPIQFKFFVDTLRAMRV